VAEDVQKAAEAVTANLEKKYGGPVLMRLGSRVGVKHPCTRTGIYPLDKNVIQAGGFPKGRIIEVFGPESGGKTTLVLQVIAEAQAAGGLAAFVDAEHALDPTWADKLGVDVDNLYVAQPDNGEQGLDIAEELVRSGAYSIIVVDSVAALVPQAELDGEVGDSHMGLHARLMSQGCRRLTAAVNKTNTTLVFINQIREKIGVMFGNPETTTGGRALKFYASLRLDVRSIGTIKSGEVAIGNKVKIKAAKNKVGAPFRECEIDLMFDSGFSKVGAVLDCGVANGAVEKSGAWYSFQGERLGQGREYVVENLRNDDELFERIYTAVTEKDEVLTAA
jgi:recombination protein RecA